jgi:hypothetical protein
VQPLSNSGKSTSVPRRNEETFFLSPRRTRFPPLKPESPADLAAFLQVELQGLSDKTSKEKLSMNRRILEKAVLSFVCALALVLLPTTYSWTQSTQQDQTDRNMKQEQQDVNQDQNLKQDDSIKDDSDTREKPSEHDSMQDREQQKGVTESESKSTTQTDEKKEGLPATAGELPLVALIGVLSLVAAAATTRFARAKR